jgi:pumilio homology domain family member 6
LLDEASAIGAVLRPLATLYPGQNSKHPIEHAHTSRLFKTLFQGGHWSQSTSSIERSQTFNAGSFASAFLRIVGENDGERVVAMAKSEGAFVVAELCERINLEGSELDKKLLRKWFDDVVMEDLERLEVRGMGVLLEKLKALKGNDSALQTNGRK